ncbi:MAG: outer membrane protein assembly factor BamA [Candidatus Pelagibacterales bacterium]|nr:MAG: outer membrane protein assembly factor BamA [Pelagibacterales bacterium]
MVSFRKISTLIILFFAFFSGNSYSEVVNKVVVNGNERISSETIMVFGDITVGANYEESDINLLIKKLYETNYFSNISVEFEDNKITINVKENPIVYSITFNGEKTKKNVERMKEFLLVKEKTSFVKNNIKTDINQIKSFYRELGYYFVKIDAEIEKLEKNRVNIFYTVDTGEKAKISKIYFLGDKKFRDTKLRDVILSEEAKFWKFLSRNIYLNKNRIEVEKRLLVNFYKNKGYYEVDLKSSNVEYSEGEGFVLTYSINAGKKYKFKKIFAEVSQSLDSEAFFSLEPEFNALVGEYYSQTKLQSLLEKIDKLSEQKELQFVNHSVLETLDDDGVEVKINIFEGKKIIIEKINIAGNTVTNDSVIRGELLVDEGDPFSELLVNKSINKIKGRNLFGKIDRKTLPGSTEDLKILEISVEEKATGEIMAGAGVGTEGTNFMFSIRENNWLGKGVRVDTAFSISEERISGNIAVTDPNYNFSGNSVSTALNVSATDRTGTTGFKSQKSGFSLGTSFEQYEDVYVSPSLSLNHEDIEAESTASDSIKKMEGTYLNSDFTYGILLDKRNQTFQTTDGYSASFYQSLPIIQDSSSISNSFFVNNWHEFSENVIGSLKFQLKSVHGIDDDVRLTNRLFIPTKRLRGFESGKVGPKDGNDWVGGNYVYGLSAEAQLPNLLPESYNTDFSVYLDTANVWGVDYSNTINNSSKLRSSIGVAANVFTPVGPLSWTFSQNLTKASSDVTETISFQLGTSF